MNVEQAISGPLTTQDFSQCRAGKMVILYNGLFNYVWFNI